MIILAVLVTTVYFWMGRNWRLITAFWISSVGAMTTSTLGKSFVARHRPEFAVRMGETDWSFPSGHTTAAMAVYGFIGYAIARELRPSQQKFEVAYWTAVLIIVIGFSRLLLGVHYMTDVLAGFIVGGFWLLVGIAMTTRNQPSQ